MLLPVVILSVFLGIVVWLASRSRSRVMLASTIGAAAFLLMCSGAPLLFWLNLAALAVAAIFCRLRDVAAWKSAIGMLLALAVSYPVAMALQWNTYRERVELARRFPEISIAGRLDYEDRWSRNQRFKRSDSDAVVTTEEASPKTGAEVNELESRLYQMRDEWRREASLRSLAGFHRDHVSVFVESRGFGVSRMPRLPARREYIEIPELPALALPAEEPDHSTPAGAPPAAELARTDDNTAPPELPAGHDLLEMHRGGVVDFVNAPGFGYVITRERVIGFQSHGFRQLPVLRHSHETTTHWELSRLELVSLLKHDTPAVYVSQTLPRMDELATHPTRALDFFERRALEKLRQGDEVFSEPSASELRLMGSLRAARQCQTCHDVPHGALLGAFSYGFRRAGALATPPKRGRQAL